MSWLTVLKTVPWGEVIHNAPKVADGARKLWKSVSQKEGPETPAAPAAPAEPAGASPAAEAAPSQAAQLAAQQRALAGLQARLDTVAASADELHAQMLASSDLIRSLAEQNALLVQRLEALHRRLRAQAAAIALLAAVALAGGAWIAWALS